MTRKEILKIAIGLFIISLLNKCIGLSREVLMAQKFGAGTEMDVYFIAMTSSKILFVVIGVALSTTLIPILLEIKEKISIEKEIEYTNNMIISQKLNF